MKDARKSTCPQQAPNQDNRGCNDDKRTCDDLVGGNPHGLVSNGFGSVMPSGRLDGDVTQLVPDHVVQSVV